MVTKEQALNCTQFTQVAYYKCEIKLVNGIPMNVPVSNEAIPLEKSKPWRANGKCKTWKRSPERFKLPIKYGLYNHSYIDETNCHLFEVIS